MTFSTLRLSSTWECASSSRMVSTSGRLRWSGTGGLCQGWASVMQQPHNFRIMRIRANASEPPRAFRQVELKVDAQGRFDELAKELVGPDSNVSNNLTLFSPSKINIFLRITNKRPDGYHDLASLFHVISLGDIIKFSISPSTTKDSLTTNVFGVPLDDKNLIIRAFNLYRKKTGSKKFFWTHLDKRVPTGAGLGGGSGNAATALWAANQLNGNLVPEKDLQEWSAEIGSDVPFFFSRGAAYCTSRGEVVTGIPSPIHLGTPMVLIKPKEECATAEVYKKFRLDQASSVDPQELLKDIEQHGISQRVCVNDLEFPAFEVLPSLNRLKQRVTAAGRGRYKAVFMTGSGSTIVGVGSAEAPQFLYDEDEYSEVFISDAYFLTRKDDEWYQQPIVDTGDDARSA